MVLHPIPGLKWKREREGGGREGGRVRVRKMEGERLSEGRETDIEKAARNRGRGRKGRREGKRRGEIYVCGETCGGQTAGGTVYTYIDR